MKDKINIDQLAKMFGLPDSESVLESNADYISSAYGEDEDEEAEQAAQEEIFGMWHQGVLNAAEALFEEHDLILVPVGSAEYPYEFKVQPSHRGAPGWKRAANKIRETINGVGEFYFSDLNDFLESGPFTARQAVLSHLAWVADYPRVYGTMSAQRMYSLYHPSRR